MSNISEEISQLSVELLMKALDAFSRLSVNSARLAYDIGKDGASTLTGLIDYLEKQHGADYDLRTRRAMAKLKEACEKEDSSAIKITVAKSDLSDIEKWLKKQDLLYVACTPKKKNGSEKEESSGLEKSEMSTIFFMQKDAHKVENAVSIQAYQKGLYNVLPPEAFFLLYDKKKDISVVDGLDNYELCVFHELAKKFGLGYTEMENKEGQKGDSIPGTFKVVCSKENADKLTAIMRLVAWSLTGENADRIKEKVMERQSIVSEVEKLISNGVKDGVQVFIDDSANQVKVENAKYIVNTMVTNQYIKLTAKGFYRYKGVGEADFVSKDDSAFEDKLEEALSEYHDYVIFDALEWEKNGLGKSNLRKEKVLEKLSVFPPNHSLEKDEEDIRKAHKKRLEKSEPLDDAAWAFYKYDPDNDIPLSEVVEENHITSSKPLTESVSTHYNSAVRRSERYKYYDVESDERSVDNIILAAKERVAGNSEYGKTKEKEEDR